MKNLVGILLHPFFHLTKISRGVSTIIFHHIEEQEGTICVPIQEWNICKISSGLKVNIGSGKRDWNDWLCFDELDYEGVSKLHFEPSVVFPVSDKSVSLFYSSHCFEHLDDATLQKILFPLIQHLLQKPYLVVQNPAPLLLRLNQIQTADFSFDSIVLTQEFYLHSY